MPVGRGAYQAPPKQEDDSGARKSQRPRRQRSNRSSFFFFFPLTKLLAHPLFQKPNLFQKPKKKKLQLKQLRREVADLLKAGKEDSARIRVEAVLREESLLQAFDALELHLELVGVRASLLEKVDAAPEDMVEALSSLAFAAPRVGDDLLPELAVLRTMLARKFGREYAEEAADEALAVSKWRVSPRLAELLAVGVPAPEAKAAALARVVAALRDNPEDRRIILSAWNPAALHEMALPPCHMMCQVLYA